SPSRADQRVHGSGRHAVAPGCRRGWWQGHRRGEGVMSAGRPPLVKDGAWIGSARVPCNPDRARMSEIHAKRRLIERHKVSRVEAQVIYEDRLALGLAEEALPRRRGADGRETYRIEDSGRVYWFVFDPRMRRIITYLPNGAPPERSRERG